MTAKELRQRAEEAVRLTRRDVAALPAQDVQRLVHELQVHQVEIEMQNESLRGARQDLERSQEQYHELFDSAPAGYLMVDASGVILRANVAAAALIGVARPRLIGQRFAAFVAIQDLLLLQANLESARWDSRASCEIQLKRSDGKQLTVRLDISPVPSRASDFLIVLTDMSERQRNLEAIERLNAQLEVRVAERTAELEARTLQLEAAGEARARGDSDRRELERRLSEAQRLESLGMLAGGIAHDFNNLLVSVMGNAELMLLEPGIPDAWREPLTLVRRAGRKAAELTRQLLVFAGRGQLHMSAVRLPHLVADSLEQIRTRLSTGVQLQTRISGELPAIQADRGQLLQLVTHLVVNALEAIDGCGVVTVDTHDEAMDAARLAQFQHASDAAPGRFAILQVHDSGPGIDSANLSRIFDPFFTTKFTGRGLGLSTVLGIVQGHHGALRVRSCPTEGTLFEVAFPLGNAAPASERPPEYRDSSWAASGSVLLIDDDDGVRAVVAQLLVRLGFEVTTSNGGAAGLELFRQRDPRFDFVVLDWIMPGFSGQQVLKALRELDPALPVVLISGYRVEELAGGDPHVSPVQKPMTLEQLRAAIRKVVPAEGNPGLRLRSVRESPV